jgi:hypothetical protein
MSERLKTRLTLEVEFDAEATDPEGLAVALDRLLETALSTPGILDDYGNPKFGEFLAAETPGEALRRFILYDHDADDLATTQVFATYAEAADAADLLDNVIVIPLWRPLTHPCDAPSTIVPMATLESAEDLPRQTLVEIVSCIQARLYLDMDGTGREFWNSGKEWSCCDVCQDVQDLLHHHGLVPGDELPVATEAPTS